MVSSFLFYTLLRIGLNKDSRSSRRGAKTLTCTSATSASGPSIVSSVRSGSNASQAESAIARNLRTRPSSSRSKTRLRRSAPASTNLFGNNDITLFCPS